MAEQVRKDATKPHLKKVIRRDGDKEVKGEQDKWLNGFNTIAQAFERAMNGKGLRDKTVHRRGR